MSVLADPKILCSDVVVAVKRLDMPPSRRPALWRERWDNSAALQREFATAEIYGSYMEGLVTGRIKIFGSES